LLDGEFGTRGWRPAAAAVIAHVSTATLGWIAAAIGGYHDGENALADRHEGGFRLGMLNLAERGFFSMDGFLRLSTPAPIWRQPRLATPVVGQSTQDRARRSVIVDDLGRPRILARMWHASRSRTFKKYADCVTHARYLPIHC
jgi:hypothetical protein